MHRQRRSSLESRLPTSSVKTSPLKESQAPHQSNRAPGTPARRAATAPEACATPELHPQAVARALAAQPTPEQVERAAALLKVVADPTRLRLLSALNAAGPGGELCVCDLAVTCHQLPVFGNLVSKD